MDETQQQEGTGILNTTAYSRNYQELIEDRNTTYDVITSL
jgi:hypothetical protein